ncbi:MAG: MFS transporter [Chloroflexi bacterium]|jgi:predicted MFS family arabinose efflux permease|nr:MFS transporter [Chloroflexota bacterium]
MIQKSWTYIKHFFRRDPTVWTTYLILLTAAVFLNSFGSGLLNGVRTNFFVDTVGLDGGQVLWLEGIREIPGLVLMFIAALTMHWALSYRAATALLIMGLGFALYATTDSYLGLLLMAVLASLGMHMWFPLYKSLGLSLSPAEREGEIMGRLSSATALASIAGMGAVALISRLLPALSLRAYYVLGGGIIALTALLLLRIPADVGATRERQPRLLLKREYWLYYVLTFFQGSRKQVLNTFGLLVLVEEFGLQVWQISLILVASGVVNFIGAPYLGRLLDRWGERYVMATSYTLLTLGCIGFATISNVGILVFLLLLIKLLVTLGIGLDTYVYRMAPPGELTPTLSAGISINHVTSVAMPLIAGALLPLIGYSGVFWGTAGLILLSIPFALAMQTDRAPQPAAQEAVGYS